MQGLYDTATLLNSSCFSILHSDFDTSYNNISIPDIDTMFEFRWPAKRFTSKKPQQPPNIVGMNRLPSLGPTAQERFLDAAVAEHSSNSSPTVSTPLLLQHGQLPGNRVHTSLLCSALSVELKDDIVEASDPFIERLFPTKRLPFPIDNHAFDALATAGYWNRKGNCFEGMVYTEDEMAKWLNNVGNTMADVYCATLPEGTTLPNSRQWWHGACNLAPGGAHITRKPDLVLLDKALHQSLQSNPRRINWLHIHSFAEVTQQKLTPPRIPETINAKSYLQFILQFDRRFVPALAVNGSGKYSLTLTDREGQIRYNGGSLVNKGLEPARIFLKILAFLMFGNDSDIGLDPNFVRDSDDDALTAIHVDGVCYKIVRRIYTLESLLGRGTKVWVVERDGVEYVLKDSWIQADRVESEERHLRLMLGHDKIKLKVPTFIAGGDVMIGGVMDSTSIYRGSGLLGRPRNQCIHRRILTTPIGEPLTNFQSKKEFIMAMVTVILAHQYLCETLHILHRDISLGNILLYRTEEGQEATGLLIDFDFSTTFIPEKASEGVPEGNLKASEVHNTALTNEVNELEVEVTAASGSYDDIQSNSMNTTDVEDRIWTGTPPFVAIEALITFPQPFIHQPRHDLESVLYVILYICTYFKGPGMMRTATDFPEFHSVPLERCFRHDGIRDIGRCKIGLMSTFKTSLLPKITPYWADFTPFVQRLIETCFPSMPDFTNALTHNNMLTILREAYDTVEEPLPESVKESAKRSATQPSQTDKLKESNLNANVASGSKMSKRRKV